jgi:hypothetical protein
MNAMMCGQNCLFPGILGQDNTIPSTTNIQFRSNPGACDRGTNVFYIFVGTQALLA